MQTKDLAGSYDISPPNPFKFFKCPAAERYDARAKNYKMSYAITGDFYNTTLRRLAHYKTPVCYERVLMVKVVKPTTKVAMTEWLPAPGSTSAMQFYSINVINNSMSVNMHKGFTNVLLMDGHVESDKWNGAPGAFYSMVRDDHDYYAFIE